MNPYSVAYQARAQEAEDVVMDVLRAYGGVMTPKQLIRAAEERCISEERARMAMCDLMDRGVIDFSINLRLVVDNQ